MMSVWAKAHCGLAFILVLQLKLVAIDESRLLMCPGCWYVVAMLSLASSFSWIKLNNCKENITATTRRTRLNGRFLCEVFLVSGLAFNFWKNKPSLYAICKSLHSFCLVNKKTNSFFEHSVSKEANLAAHKTKFDKEEYLHRYNKRLP